MYPLFKTTHALRGTEEVPRIVLLTEPKEIRLPSVDVTDLLFMCNGVYTIDQLGKKFKVEKDVLTTYIEGLASLGAVELHDTPQPIQHNGQRILGKQEPWLRELHIDITGQCNLYQYCQHCFRGDKLRKQEDLPVSKWIKVIDEASRMGTYLVAISGGEPFLYSGLPRIVNTIIDRKMLLNGIFTNGTVWTSETEEVVRRISNSQLMTSFFVSIDGRDEATHDKNRGQGSYQKTTEFLKKLRDLREKRGGRFKIVANSFIDEANYTDLSAWYADLKSLGFDRWRLTSGRVVGRLRVNQSILAPIYGLFLEYAKLLDTYFDDHDAGVSTMHLNIDGFFSSSMMNGVAYIFDPELPVCDYKHDAVSIEPTGDVQFCTSWMNGSFGNVFKSTLSSIWYSDELRSAKATKIKDVTDCLDCELLRWCGTGCRTAAASFISKDPMSCLRYALFREIILPMLEARGITFRVESD